MGFRQTVRWKLTFWYALVLLLSLACVGAVVDAVMRQSLTRLVDRDHLETQKAVVNILRRSREEHMSLNRLQNEIDELNLSSETALRLQLPDGKAVQYNARAL